MKMLQPAGTLNSGPVQSFSRSNSFENRFAKILLSAAAAEETSRERFKGLLALISHAACLPHAVEAIRKILQEQDIEPLLRQAEVYTEGHHRVSNGIVVVAGDARVEAEVSGLVMAVGQARVRARGICQVWVTDRVHLDAYDDVKVYASGEAVVSSYGKVTGSARDAVVGRAHASSSWILEGDRCFFDSMDNSQVSAIGGTVRAYGRSRIRAAGATNVSLFDSANGWFKELVQAVISGNSLAYSEDSVRISVRGDARKFPLSV